MKRRISLTALGAGLVAPWSVFAQTVTPAVAKPASAAASSPARTQVQRGGRVVALSGDCELVKSGGERKPLKQGQQVMQGESVETKGDGEVLLRFADQSQLLVRSNAQVEFEVLRAYGALAQREKTIKLLRGGLRYITGALTRKQGVRFSTPTATIGIRGTDLEILVNEAPTDDLAAGTILKVSKGEAQLNANDGTDVDVRAGEWALGTEPELVPRGGVRRRNAARALTGAAQAAAKALVTTKGKLDGLMR